MLGCKGIPGCGLILVAVLVPVNSLDGCMKVKQHRFADGAIRLLSLQIMLTRGKECTHVG